MFICRNRPFKCEGTKHGKRNKHNVMQHACNMEAWISFVDDHFMVIPFQLSLFVVMCFMHCLCMVVGVVCCCMIVVWLCVVCVVCVVAL